MRKARVVLALIAFACDLPRDVLVNGDPAGRPETAAVSRNDYEYRRDLREPLDDVASPGSSEAARSDDPVGRWRSNGEALEPKWRDGDSVPLLPFSQYRPYSRDDDADDDDDEVPDDQVEQDGANTRRSSLHRYPGGNQPRNRPRGSARRLSPLADEHDYAPPSAYRNRDYDRIVPAEDYPRNRRRPPPRDPPRENDAAPASNAGKDVDEDGDDEDGRRREAESARYREAFQARPNEYEHEFEDEEYLRPRPRKRRPPQNYEFALAEEAAAAAEADPPPADDDVAATRPPDHDNALELKSLLKMQQEEGSSLSEILQRRNLTLGDLLKGRADVIDALKSRTADDESEDEYIEEMSRVMSNSLMRLGVAVAASPDAADGAATPLRVRTTMTTAATTATTVDTSRPSERTTWVTQERSSAHDSARPRATTPPGISTVITTSTSVPAAMSSSVEYFLNDDGGGGGGGGGGSAGLADRVARLENLDEDEIMEFSDFTDFKKAKSPATASARSSDEPRSAADGAGDSGGGGGGGGSTLSIERILNPTERVEPTRDGGGATARDRARSFPEEDYDRFVETEYRGDTMRINSSVSATAEAKVPPPAVVGRARDEDRTSATASQRDDAENGGRYEEIVSEIEPEARAEIFELFASGSAGKRLERLLKSRNMSVEELIALRQRGSSKVHLTEVSRLRVPPEPRSPPRASAETPTANGPDRELDVGPAGRDGAARQDVVSYLHEPFPGRNAENASLSRLLNLVERDRNASREATLSDGGGGVSEHPRRTVHIVDLLTTFGSLPFAKDVRRQFDPDNGLAPETRPPEDDEGAGTIGEVEEGEKAGARSRDSSSEVQAGHVEEIARENAVDVETIYVKGETAGAGDDRKSLLKVKPSIIASGAILGVTIVVFLAIFIVCRVRQRQKYTYRNTFSRAVFQGPVSAARKLSNSSSLSAVMVNVVATSTTKRPERTETQEVAENFDGRSDMDNDSLDANDSWETIPDYAK